jgi:hypothetical protein
MIGLKDDLYNFSVARFSLLRIVLAFFSFQATAVSCALERMRDFNQFERKSNSYTQNSTVS